MNQDFLVRPNGADHQWGEDPPIVVVGDRGSHLDLPHRPQLELAGEPMFVL